MTKKRRVGLRLPMPEYVKLLNEKLRRSQEEGRKVTADTIVKDALTLYFAHERKPKVPKVKDKDIKSTSVYLRDEERIRLMKERVKRVAEESREVPQSQILREALAIYHAEPHKHKKSKKK